MKFIPEFQIIDSGGIIRDGELIQSDDSGTPIYLRIKEIFSTGIIGASLLKRRPRNHKGEIPIIPRASIFENQDEAIQNQTDEMESRRKAEEFVRKANEERKREEARKEEERKRKESKDSKDSKKEAERKAKNEEIIRIVEEFLSVSGIMFGEGLRGFKTAMIYRLGVAGFSASDIWHGMESLDEKWGGNGKWRSTKGCVARRIAEFRKGEEKVFRCRMRYSF